MIRTVEPDGSQGRGAFGDGFMIGILAPAPRDAIAGDPVIVTSVGIYFFDDGIVESPTAEAGDANPGGVPKWAIRRIEIHQRFFGQSLLKNHPRHSHRIVRPDLEAKPPYSLL